MVPSLGANAVRKLTAEDLQKAGFSQRDLSTDPHVLRVTSAGAWAAGNGRMRLAVEDVPEQPWGGAELPPMATEDIARVVLSIHEHISVVRLSTSFGLTYYVWSDQSPQAASKGVQSFRTATEAAEQVARLAVYGATGIWQR